MESLSNGERESKLSKALQNVKLRKADVSKDERQSGILGEEDPNAILTEKEVLEMKRNHFAANLDRLADWIPTEYTLQTVTVPLSVEDATALLHNNPHRKKKNDNTISEEELKQRLQRLEDSITKTMQSFNNSDGFFIKLSCRSPKDSTVTSDKTKQLYKEMLHEKPIKVQKGTSMEFNKKICYLYQCSLNSLRIYTAEEGLELLSQSKRIAFDLELDLRFPKEFSTHIILRPWIKIPMEMEFRAFVSEKKMTALSQYYSYCYFPHLAAQKESLQNLILSFFDKVKDKIKLDSYVIDFLVLNNEVKVLELNPFNASTGGCLFDWDSEEDEHILRNGPFQFRIATSHPPVNIVLDQLNKEWKQWITER